MGENYEGDSIQGKTENTLNANLISDLPTNSYHLTILRASE